MKHDRSNYEYHYYFYNDPTTPEIYTLPLHYPLPILQRDRRDGRLLVRHGRQPVGHLRLEDARGLRGHAAVELADHPAPLEDRKSTRLNSSYANISYAVFCLKKNT